VSKAQGFVEATASYEKWRAGRIEVVESDLATKHAKIAQSPFVLLRGTYYRFLQQLPALVPDAWDAPKTVAIGDLHVENYGTWRDACGRIGWGINDFDEIDVQPYPVDLVRLATSTLLAISASHIELEPHAACAAILDGWHRRIEQGLPTAFVLAERHPHLLKLASETFQTPARFAKAIEALPPFDGKLAKGTVKLLDEVVPWGGFDPSLRTRTAGVGSLGSRRIVAFDEVGGGLLVRECKQVPGSSWSRRRAGRGPIPGAGRPGSGSCAR